MHILRLGLKMRKNGISNAEDINTGFKSSDFSQHNKLGTVVNSAKKSALKTSTSSNSNKLFIYVVALVGILFAFSSYSDTYGVSAMPRCPPGEFPDPPEGSCTYGIVTNFCGRRVCAKGPGEVCGTGMFKMLGTCGDGLYCNCGRCIGCSIFTMECYDKTCTK